MDTTRIPGHDDHDDTVEAHYSGLERLEAPHGTPHACLNGYVYIGHMAVDPETGEEAEIVEAVPCKRCASERSAEASRGGNMENKIEQAYTQGWNDGCEGIYNLDHGGANPTLGEEERAYMYGHKLAAAEMDMDTEEA